MIRKSCLRVLRRVIEDSDSPRLWGSRGHLGAKGMGWVYRWLYKHALIEARQGCAFPTVKGRELAARFAGYDCTSRGMLRHRGACKDCGREGEHYVVRGESPAQALVDTLVTPSGLRVAKPGRQALALCCDGCRVQRRRLAAD